MNVHLEAAYPADTWRRGGTLANGEEIQETAIVLPLFLLALGHLLPLALQLGATFGLFAFGRGALSRSLDAAPERRNHHQRNHDCDDSRNQLAVVGSVG